MTESWRHSSHGSPGSLCPCLHLLSLPYSPPCYPLDRLKMDSKALMLFSKQNIPPQYKINACSLEKARKTMTCRNKCPDPPIHTNTLIYCCPCPSSPGFKVIFTERLNVTLCFLRWQAVLKVQ